MGSQVDAGKADFPKGDLTAGACTPGRAGHPHATYHGQPDHFDLDRACVRHRGRVGSPTQVVQGYDVPLAMAATVG